MASLPELRLQSIFANPLWFGWILWAPRAGGHPTAFHQAETWGPEALFIKGQVPV